MRISVSWVAAAALTSMPQPAPAQAPPDLKLGIWHGWITQESLDSTRAAFDVEADKKHIYITLRTRGSADYGMSGVKLKDDVLTFDWYLGAGGQLYCRLSRHGGIGFDGTCTDRRPGPTGQPIKIWMNMMPPRDQGRGNAVPHSGE